MDRHNTIKTIGQFRGKVKYGEKQSEELIFVIRGLKTNLLRLAQIMALKIAARTDAVIDQKTQLLINIYQCLLDWHHIERSTPSN